MRLWLPFLLVCLLTGCSPTVSLMSSNFRANLDAVEPGVARDVIELQLGPPSSETLLRDGRTQVSYVFDTGRKEDSVATGLGHLVWGGFRALFGTATGTGPRQTATVIYDRDGVVEQVVELPLEFQQERSGPFADHATKEVRIIGRARDETGSRIRSRRAAVVDAKRQACFLAGLVVSPRERHESQEAYAQEVERKASLALLPGYEIMDIGFQVGGDTYRAVLVGRIRVIEDELTLSPEATRRDDTGTLIMRSTP